jgi:phosphomannomutase
VKTALLFDIDNTLTPPRQPLQRSMVEILKRLVVPFHVAAGSHIQLLREQFFEPLHAFGFRGQFDAFISNGGIHYRCDYSKGMSLEMVSAFDIRDHLGEANYDFLIKVLKKAQEMPEFQLPASFEVMGETTTYRGSMINFVPIGRIEGDSPEYRRSRDNFVEFDRAANFRARMMEHLKRELSLVIENSQLTISLGGQTSFDINVATKDKANAVWTLLNNGVERIVFLGDALFEGGNDAPIREIAENWSSATPCPLEAIQVSNWDDTIEKLHRMKFIGEQPGQEA